MTWIEQRLSELATEGFFDDLPGTGEPIPDLETRDSPAWWAQRWVQRDAARRAAEKVRGQLASDIAQALALPRPEARERLVQIQAAITALNTHLSSTEQLTDFDVDTILIRRRWPP